MIGLLYFLHIPLNGAMLVLYIYLHHIVELVQIFLQLIDIKHICDMKLGYILLSYDDQNKGYCPARMKNKGFCHAKK